MSEQPRPAGLDTREARTTPQVRSAALAAAAVSAPGWLAVFALAAAWSRWLPGVGDARAWVAAAALGTGLVAAAVAWRRPVPTAGPRGRALPAGGDAAVALTVLALVVALADDDVLTAASLALGPPVGGWIVGRAARAAAAAVSSGARAAAGGLVTCGALAGLVPAAHLAAVLAGTGPRRAATWTTAYLCVGVLALARARPGGKAALVHRAAPDPPPALAVQGIAVSFGAQRVLNGVSLTVERGEVVALTGGNGAGKSTLLRVVAGFLDPDRGAVYAGGEDVSLLLPEERVAMGIAFVSGARPVFPDLTVAQNLRVAAFGTHLTAAAFARATDAVLEVVPVLRDRLREPAGVLSGGEQRMLALAQCLYRRPRILLADELTLGLHAGARASVFGLLRSLADDGVAVVVVDHDLPMLLPLADRALLLADGSLASFAPALRVLEARDELLPASFLVGAGR